MKTEHQEEHTGDPMVGLAYAFVMTTSILAIVAVVVAWVN